jgi:hypothetical protein
MAEIFWNLTFITSALHLSRRIYADFLTDQHGYLLNMDLSKIDPYKSVRDLYKSAVASSWSYVRVGTTSLHSEQSGETAWSR